jgi:hypothetical protein
MAGDDALRRLADLLREDGSVIGDHLVEADAAPVLGRLAAAGPRTADYPHQYAVLVEAVREGYLLHYGSPRLVRSPDPDLRLLAGDYLYALGLERLAALGDMEAVRELADLISISAQLHAERDGAGADALWLASVMAVAAGGGPAHQRAKLALRSGEPGAADGIRESAREAAAGAGLESAFLATAESIESPSPPGANRG